MLIFKIAFLNVIRNFRRSLITVLAITFGSVSLIVFGGFAEGMYDGLKESMIRSRLGHIQVYKNGYNEFGRLKPEAYMLNTEETQKIISIVSKFEEVEIVTKRLNFSGLLSNGNNSIGVFGIGMEAEKEALLNSAVKIVDGDDLFPEDADSALIGEGAAKSLGVKVGEVLTLLSSTVDGTVNAVDLTIAGVMSTGTKEIDDRIVRANLPHIKNLLYTEDLTKVVLLLKKTEDTDLIRAKLAEEFKKAGLDLEFKTWSELAGFYHKVVKLFNNLFGFIKIVVMAIVVLGIANTMMMAVMERTSEIGTIRAMGNTRWGVLRLFLLEAVYLGLIGGVLGIVAGILAAKGITASEFMMPPPPGTTSGFPIRIYIVEKFLWESMILGASAAFISSIYPSFKASRLKIVDALRFI
jgi:putative ABC transport system permease protein